MDKQRTEIKEVIVYLIYYEEKLIRLSDFNTRKVQFHWVSISVDDKICEPIYAMTLAYLFIKKVES